MAQVKERGAAKIILDLHDGVITVRHGEGNSILAQWTANEGDWDQIWNAINVLKAQGKEVSQ